MLCGDLVSRRLPLTTFQATRPVAVGELVWAKLKAVFAVWLSGWLLAVLSVSAWAVLSGQVDNLFDQMWGPRGLGADLTVIIALSLHVLVGLFPLWLTGRVPGLPWSFVALLITYIGLGEMIGWFGRHPDFRDTVLLLIGFAAAGKLGLAFLGFRQALMQILVKRGFVLGSVSVWIVGTAFFLWLVSLMADRSNWDEVLL